MRATLLISLILLIVTVDSQSGGVKPDCVCPAVYQPVCAIVDGEIRTYGNACQVGCAVGSDKQIIYEGVCQCAQNCNCPDERSPVCGTDGKTYSSCCIFSCRNPYRRHTIAGEGTCEENFKICEANAPVNIQQVCGSDGREYSSDGDVECHRKWKGRSDLRVVNQGRCRKYIRH